MVDKKSLDFIWAMSVIAKTEKSQNKSNYDYLNSKLGHETFKKMVGLGFIRTGFHIIDGKIVDTYGLTKSYKKWDRILNRKTISQRLKNIFL